jgi:hypothetical protein
MTRVTLERLARDLAAEIALPAADWEAIIVQAELLRRFVDGLDELPLDSVEPASIFKVT